MHMCAKIIVLASSYFYILHIVVLSFIYCLIDVSYSESGLWMLGFYFTLLFSFLGDGNISPVELQKAPLIFEKC